MKKHCEALFSIISTFSCCFIRTHRQPCAQYPSKRALETITPLSQATGLKVDLSFIEDQEAELAHAITTSTHQVTLVAWEHKKLIKARAIRRRANHGAAKKKQHRLQPSFIFVHKIRNAFMKKRENSLLNSYVSLLYLDCRLVFRRGLSQVMTALGVANAPEYPGDRFDLIWTVPLDGTGAYSQSTQPPACTFPA